MSGSADRDPQKSGFPIARRAQPENGAAETAGMARMAPRFAPSKQLSLASADQHETNELRALCSEVFRWTACRAHMCVDSRGHVAAGAGHRLPSAAAAATLPWRHSGSGTVATRAEIADAYRRVRAQGPGQKTLTYRLASDLALSPGVAADLVMARIAREVLPGLRTLFRSFDRYPAPAQRALVEMAVDLGLTGLSKFRNLIAACERGNFSLAAEHCLRRGHRELRNAATRALFSKAADYPASDRRRWLVNGVRCG
jgi:hypothetical protein